MVYGEQSTSLHRANAIKTGGPTEGVKIVIILLKWTMCKPKVCPWYVFYFIGLRVVVGRPGYRIVCRTIKGGSQVGSLIVLLVESSNHCILASCFLVLVWLSLWVLELMVILMTSLSSSKAEFACVFYDVFGVGGFTGLIRWRVLTISYGTFLICLFLIFLSILC